jgi:hypothetical protein
MPAAHRAHMEWTPQRLIEWGQRIGMACGELIARLLQTYKHPEHGYRSCLGLLSNELKDLTMMMNNTLAQLRELKLVGMATAVEEQLSSTASTTLSFEERLALMVDREVHQRADKRHVALLKRARLKYPQACIEDVDGRAGRGFERSALMSLALSRWVEDGTAILITGPTEYAT